MTAEETIASAAKGLDRMIYRVSGQQVDRSAALSIHQPALSCIWEIMSNISEIAKYDHKI